MRTTATKSIYAFLSSFILIIILGANALVANDYCIPPFFDRMGPNPFSGITSVELNSTPSLSNSTAYNDKYVYFSSLQAAGIRLGQEYRFDLEIYQTTPQNTTIWIDWNQDKDFDDEGETVVEWFNHENGSISKSFTVPVDAVLGITRMRVYTDRSTSEGHISPEPCGYMNHPDHQLGHFGNVEDYNVNVLESNEPLIYANLIEIDFGEVNVGKTSEKSFTMFNMGTVDLTISEILVEWDDYEVFTLPGLDLPVTLSQYDSVTINVNFQPKDEDLYFANLNIKSNAGNNTELLIDLVGDGIVVGPRAVLSTNSLDFGEVAIGQSKELQFVISNTGDDDLEISNLDLLFDYDGVYSLPDLEYPFTLTPDNFQVFTVTFSPVEEAEYESYLLIKSNSSDDEPRLDFTGTGIVGTPELDISSGSFVFGSVAAGTVKTDTLIISNTGTSQLLIPSIVFRKNDDNAYFLDELSFPIAIAAGDSENVNIHFKPMQEKFYIGELVVTSNAQAGGTQYINLEGQGQGTSLVGHEYEMDAISMTLQPNPSINSAYLEYSINGGTQKNLELFITDINGRKVASLMNTTLSPGDYAEDIDVGNLASGRYFLIAIIDGIAYELPLIIQR